MVDFPPFTHFFYSHASVVTPAIHSLRIAESDLVDASLYENQSKVLAALLNSGKLEPSADGNLMITTALEVGDVATAESLLAMPGYASSADEPGDTN